MIELRNTLKMNVEGFLLVVYHIVHGAHLRSRIFRIFFPATRP
jgi:hypothetical protein